MRFDSNSSNIKSVAWEQNDANKDTGFLTIEFRSGRTYEYFDVPREVYLVTEAVERQAGSCGSHFNKTIRGVFEYEEIS